MKLQGVLSFAARAMFAVCLSLALLGCRSPIPSGSTGAAVEAASPRTPWLEPGQRTRVFPSGYRLEDQEGRWIGEDPGQGRPFAVSFLYTRCQNSNKCPRVAFVFGDLQQRLAKAGLSQRTGLVLLTYDPERDTPARLVEFALAHDIRPDENVRLLRPDAARKQELFRDLSATVNFNGAEVNIHGIQLLLFDARRRLVRSYHTLMWDNADVVRDLARLAAEP